MGKYIRHEQSVSLRRGEVLVPILPMSSSPWRIVALSGYLGSGKTAAASLATAAAISDASPAGSLALRSS